jgi:hypothetical protein
LAARVAINTNADVGQSFQSGDFLIPEISAFVIGEYGRFEVGERAAFPQSLVGFTPSEIAFTAAEFGPESGARLDPDGRLPPTFLQNGLASRINALTYLGYSWLLRSRIVLSANGTSGGFSDHPHSNTIRDSGRPVRKRRESERFQQSGASGHCV